MCDLSTLLWKDNTVECEFDGYIFVLKPLNTEILKKHLTFMWKFMQRMRDSHFNICLIYVMHMLIHFG